MLLKFSQKFLVPLIITNLFQYPRILTPRTIISAFLHWLPHPTTHQGRAKKMMEERHDVQFFFWVRPSAQFSC